MQQLLAGEKEKRHHAEKIYVPGNFEYATKLRLTHAKEQCNRSIDHISKGEGEEVISPPFICRGRPNHVLNCIKNSPAIEKKR